MNRKRILSLLLAALLMLSTFPAALAVDGDDPQGESTSQEGSTSQENPVRETPVTDEDSVKQDLSGAVEDSEQEQETDDDEDTVEDTNPVDDSQKETTPETSVPPSAEDEPSAKDQVAAQADSLVALTWENVSYELKTGEADSVSTSKIQDTGELITDDDGVNAIIYTLKKDSAEGTAEITFTLPAELAEDEYVVCGGYFRPGDQFGYTTTPFEYKVTSAKPFKITLPEADSPTVYRFQFGILDDGEFVQKTYEYIFEFRVQRYEYLTWEDVDYTINDGVWVGEGRSPLTVYPYTNELYIVGNELEQGNVLQLELEREDESTPASATFTVSKPEFLSNVVDLKAKVWASLADLNNDNAEIKDLTTDGAVEFTVAENSQQKPTVQFGIVENSTFVPLTYQHPFCFRVTYNAQMTWDDIEIEVVGGESEINYYPGRDEPLYKHGNDNVNFIDVFIESDDDAVTPSVNFKVKRPAALPNNIADADLVVSYYSYERGDLDGEVISRRVSFSELEAISIPVYDNRVYCFKFYVYDPDNGLELLSRTYQYDFCIDVLPITKLTWANIAAFDSSGTQFAEEDIDRDPNVNEALYNLDDEYANSITVSSADLAAGDKVTFKITCPVEDTTNVIARYISFVKGLQTNPDAQFEDIKLDEDGSFTIDIDVIGAADITQVIHSLAFVNKDYTQVTPWYHFDFIAQASGTVVNATTEANGSVLTATVADSAIADAIDGSEDSTISIDANGYYDGSVIETTQIELGSTDVDAVIANDITLEIATPIGTVTLPPEAIEQAKGDEENASIILEVASKDGETIQYQNISVEAIQNVEVTLYRIVGDAEPEAIPIRMTGSNAITVNVRIMEGLTLNEPTYYLVYLPESGSAVLERTVKPSDIDTNSCLTFTTSHLSEFALFTYEQAQKLGLFNTGSSGTTSKPSSGGGTAITPSASIDVTLKTGSNGTVTISPSKPKEGDKVTITVKPNSGYELDDIRATADGKTVRLTEEDDNVFTFTMPEDEVTVTTTFKRIVEESIETTSTAIAFYDVASSDWYANAVAFVSERGMMAGNNGRFTPNDNLTRGMMAQILYNLEGASGNGSITFPDVQASDWFAGAVAWAASQSLMDGYGSGAFGPNDSITREQLASILYRYARAKGYGTNASAELTSFVDGASTSSWAAESVRWAVGSGLLTGKSGSRLDPTGTATRAEVAQILMNFYTQVAI